MGSMATSDGAYVFKNGSPKIKEKRKADVTCECTITFNENELESNIYPFQGVRKNELKASYWLISNVICFHFNV